MSSQPASMADDRDLPEEILIWEILVRLDAKSLLRCRAVRRAWRCATSTHRFLLAHHARQPALPIVRIDGSHNILAFDHRPHAAAQLHTVARIDKPFILASCDGLLVLSRSDRRACLAVCNPATREHASLRWIPWNFSIVGMYPHRPTGEYRLLLQRRGRDLPKDQIGCYVFPVGSGPPPRYIGWPEIASAVCLETPALVRDSLHLFLMKNYGEGKQIWVFDTTAESFRQMRAPVVPGGGDLFLMDGTLGIHAHNDAMEIVTIWVLHDYESEVWELKYRIKLPVAEIREQFEYYGERWSFDVVSGDGDVLLLVGFGGWLLQVDSDGKLIDSFNCGHRDLRMYKHRLKQSLVQHTFFPAQENYAANASLFI